MFIDFENVKMSHISFGTVNTVAQLAECGKRVVEFLHEQRNKTNTHSSCWFNCKAHLEIPVPES